MHCGIDFGTSNSAVAVADDKTVTLARIEQDSETLPSALFYGVNQAPAFGRAAIRQFFEGHEGRFMRSLKRVLATELMSQGTVINGRRRRFEDIIGDFVGHLKTRAEESMKAAIDNVVMGRPVHFVDGDISKDRIAEAQLGDIARKAGFSNISFQFEPIAAAFAHEQKIVKEKLALVADIGGGTSDFTVIRLSQKNMSKTDRTDDILANTGIRVGGNDLDKALSLKSFMPEMGYHTTYGDKNLLVPNTIFHELSEWSKVNFIYTPQNRHMVATLYKESHMPEKVARLVNILENESGHKLLSAVEATKIELTGRELVESHLPFIADRLFVDVPKDDFTVAITPDIEKIDNEITNCLNAAGVNDNDIGLIILTGGTTEVPALNSRIKSRFKTAEVSEENKLASVGLGLGYDALRKFG